LGLNRKLKRQRMKKQMKQTRKALKNVAKRMNSLGDECANCSTEFDRTNVEETSKWMVYVMGDQPNLICPDCYEMIQEAKSNYEEEGDAEAN